MSLDQDSANVFSEGLGSKYFRLCELYSLWYNLLNSTTASSEKAAIDKK